MNRALFEEDNAQDLQDFVETELELQLLLDNRHQHIDADGDPDLRLHRILLKKVYERAKRFFEIPDFKHYAIADGIYRILLGYRAGLREMLPKPLHQLFFPFARLD